MIRTPRVSMVDGSRAERPIWWLGFAAALAACGSVKSNGNGNGNGNGDGPPDGPGAIAQICTANQVISCVDHTLTACSGDGSARVTSTCVLGCNAVEPRCEDVAPSNNLGQYLDIAHAQPDLDLGASATIDTTNGTVVADGQPVAVYHVAMTQPSGPTVQVFVVRSLIATDVAIIGTNAIAVVSDGAMQIKGKFTVSGNGAVAGPGGFNDAVCKGKDGTLVDSGGVAESGAGGGGFGTPGGNGGDASSVSNASSRHGDGGQVTGNAELVPLRGGCDGGLSQSHAGGGGGAVQLVSRLKISIPGIVSANGSDASVGGGGSGGGILLEAPEVDVSGAVVANGAGGSGNGSNPSPGDAGHFDATPAPGGPASSGPGVLGGAGGMGGVGGQSGGAGSSVSTTTAQAFAGCGGGGVGRIRINTLPAALHGSGVFSPIPSTGTISTR